MQRGAKSTDAARRPLDALNFFLADVRDGLGPYLAIYLLTVQKWDEASTGLVMTIAGIAGIVTQAPAGALVDGTKAKRALIIAASILVTATCLVLPFLTDRILITVTQAISGAAGGVFAPAIAAITLGLVGPKQFAARTGRNESFNHAGNAVAAGAAAVLSYWYGPIVVFWLMAAMAAFSIAATLCIPADAIDHDLARGLSGPSSGEQDHKPPSGWRVLAECRPLLIFAACTVLFHFANAAMLPLAGQKLALGNAALGTSLMSACIVAAQVIMVPVAYVTGSKADVWGRKPLFLAAFTILTVRGLLYPLSDSPYWIVGVQLLDGVGAGIFGALFPIIVADLTRGTGHFNVSLGTIGTATGIGAALSTSFAGLIVVHAGYGPAFLALAAIAAVGLVCYLTFMPETRDTTVDSSNGKGASQTAAPLSRR